MVVISGSMRTGEWHYQIQGSIRAPSEICCGYFTREIRRKDHTQGWLGEPLAVGILQYQGLPSVPIGSPLIGSLRGLRAEVDETGNGYRTCNRPINTGVCRALNLQTYSILLAGRFPIECALCALFARLSFFVFVFVNVCFYVHCKHGDLFRQLNLIKRYMRGPPIHELIKSLFKPLKKQIIIVDIVPIPYVFLGQRKTNHTTRYDPRCRPNI